MARDAGGWHFALPPSLGRGRVSPQMKLAYWMVLGVGPGLWLQAESVQTAEPAERLGPRIMDRVACSSLTQCKQPINPALQVISSLGYRWVDLSCLDWAPHVRLTNLMANFEQEAAGVEAALARNRLRVANLTFDAPDTRPWPQYEQEFREVARLAARLRARLINLMAPSAKADRADAVQKLRRLQRIASDHGVLLTVETHVGQITERPADALWLCQQVPGLGLTLDPSHYYAGPHQGGSLDELLPLVQGTGFRAGGTNWASIQLPWGEGPIDFVDLVRKLEQRGYAGFYVSEYIEGFNALDAVEQARRFLPWAKGL